MHVLLDFDGTLTVRDTIGALARAAIVFQGERGGGASRTAWARRWQAIVDAYAADCRAHCAAYPTPAAADGRAFRDSLRAVERRSVQRVEAAGLFAGMSEAQLEAAGRRAVAGDGTAGTDGVEEKVELRRGAAALFAEAATRDWPVSIVSVNWSDAWVRGVLSAAATAATAAAAARPILANTTTDAGRIVRNGRCPAGDDGGPLLTAEDKLQALQRATRSTSGAFLYVGDSLTDLDCLLYAASCARASDRGGGGGGGGGGIVMVGAGGEADSALLETLRQKNDRVPHVSEPEAARFRGGGQDAETAPTCLAWARDLDEVVALLFKEE